MGLMTITEENPARPIAQDPRESQHRAELGSGGVARPRAPTPGLPLLGSCPQAPIPGLPSLGSHPWAPILGFPCPGSCFQDPVPLPPGTCRNLPFPWKRQAGATFPQSLWWGMDLAWAFILIRLSLSLSRISHSFLVLASLSLAPPRSLSVRAFLSPCPVRPRPPLPPSGQGLVPEPTHQAEEGPEQGL